MLRQEVLEHELEQSRSELGQLQCVPHEIEREQHGERKHENEIDAVSALDVSQMSKFERNEGTYSHRCERFGVKSKLVNLNFEKFQVDAQVDAEPGLCRTSNRTPVFSTSTI